MFGCGVADENDNSNCNYNNGDDDDDDICDNNKMGEGSLTSYKFFFVASVPEDTSTGSINSL